MRFLNIPSHVGYEKTKSLESAVTLMDGHVHALRHYPVCDFAAYTVIISLSLAASSSSTAFICLS